MPRGRTTPRTTATAPSSCSAPRAGAFGPACCHRATQPSASRWRGGSSPSTSPPPPRCSCSRRRGSGVAELLIIDGDNVAHRLVDAVPERRRDDLLTLVSAYAEQAGTDVVVIFDGHGSDMAIGRVSVQHAQSETADSVIERLAHRRAETDPGTGGSADTGVRPPAPPRPPPAMSAPAVGGRLGGGCLVRTGGAPRCPPRPRSWDERPGSRGAARIAGGDGGSAQRLRAPEVPGGRCPRSGCQSGFGGDAPSRRKPSLTNRARAICSLPSS